MSAKKQQDNRVKARQKDFPNSKWFLPSVLILTGIVFYNTLSNDFVYNWDDCGYIIDNERLKDFSWAHVQVMFSTFFEGNYHPLTLLTNAIEYHFFGLNPFYFHFFNYCLHLFNTALVYFFIRRLTGKTVVAAVTALFFGIHPMHVESVAWISERKDVLYSFFFLLSLNSYCKYLVDGRKSSVLWSFFWFFLSLLSKSAAACLPAVLILIDFYMLKKISWRTFFFKTHFFILGLIFIILALFSQKIEPIHTQFGVFDRILLVFYSVGFYLWEALFPFRLSAIHFYPEKTGGMLPLIYYLVPFLILALVWGVFKSGKFRRELIFGLSFYLITIAMVLQIVPIGRAVVSERYSYIPYIGIFFIAGQLLTYVHEGRLPGDKKVKNRLVLSGLLLVIFFSFMTHERNKKWKNGVVLFSDVVEKYPTTAFAWRSLGEGKIYENDKPGALAAYQEAIRFDSTDFLSYMNRGILYMYANRMKESQCDLDKSIAMNPAYSETYYNRGNLYYAQGNYQKAIMDYSMAIKLKPDHIKAYNNRAVAKYDLKDNSGACSDWLAAKQLGDPGAENALTTYCR